LSYPNDEIRNFALQNVLVSGSSAKTETSHLPLLSTDETQLVSTNNKAIIFLSIINLSLTQKTFVIKQFEFLTLSLYIQK